MTQMEQKKAAKKFVKNWSGHGYEKGESQKFWIDLLTSVFAVTDIASFIFFEEQVKDCIQNKTITNFIDACIPSTRVMIEQKSSHKDLREPIKQSDGRLLTPFHQAKKYVADLPLSQHPKWIVTCNFDEFLIYDMERPGGQPEQVFLKDLKKDFYRLSFLVDQKNENIRREEEISLKAGKLVGKLYDVIMPEYICHSEFVSESKNDGLSTEQARSLNILCVRIVFCLYAEDAGLFETKTSFEDYIRGFKVPNVRMGLINLFKALDTKIADRDAYDESLKPFPYVNGGLFKDENIEIPNFTREIVDVIVNDCAVFNWSEISPTIFGAVFESTLNPETRRKGGMHYTSIANIHKVIDPLFMDELEAEFEEIVGSTALTNRNSTVLTNCSPRSLSVVETSVVETSDSSKGVFDRSNHRKKLSPKERTAALHAFQEKLGSLTFLDPACGSGNFLTETYLSLRRLENKVISLLNNGNVAFDFDGCIKVHINQFYGIEINDFAVTVAKTALWIAESQMVAETEAIISQTIDFLPLTDHANIVEGNALRLDWATLSKFEDRGLLFTEKLNIFEKAPFNKRLEVHAPTFEEAANRGRYFKELNVVAKEVEYKKSGKQEQSEPMVYDYIMGNQPFVGFTFMTAEQKSDMQLIFPGVKNLDYVCCWYKKASDFIQGTKTHCAFVSTNSITQGETVARFAPFLKIKYDFAYRTFVWDSESTQKAHVHCVIIGFSCGGSTSLTERSSTSPGKRSSLSEVEGNRKFIFDADGNKTLVSEINAYLVDAPNIIVDSRPKPLGNVSKMIYGNKPADGGFLIIEEDACDDFIRKDPAAKKFVRPLLGAVEFLHNKKRWCLWLEGASPAEIKKCPLVYERVKKCKESRENSIAEGIRKFADTPHLFAQRTQPAGVDYIIVPRVSSENRRFMLTKHISSR